MTSQQQVMLEWALIYERLGYSVIPIGADKKPFAGFSWKKYQRERATSEVIKRWFVRFPDMNLGLITGEISRLTVVDIDQLALPAELSRLLKNGFSTPWIRTGGNRHQLYFQYDPDFLSRAAYRENIDVKNAGGYVIAPPSLHPSGRRYEHIVSPQTVAPAIMPQEIKDWVLAEVETAELKKFDPEVLQGVTEGSRNEIAASVAGKLLKRFPKHEWDMEVWPLLNAWNNGNTPPLPQDELRGVYESIKPREEQKREKADATNKVIYALDIPRVIDVVDAGEKLQYLTVDLGLVDSIKLGDEVYAPPPKETCPYYFAQADEVFRYIKEHTENNCAADVFLYQDLFTYHTEISDLPQEDFYHLLVLWDIHTYLLEKLHFSPLLYLYAVKERGKSRTAKGALYVARRGIFTECVREADIIRWGNDHRAALGFDVKNFPKKIERANCDDLILARFEKGSVSSRTLWPEKGAFKDTKVFQLFGATIIATNRPVDDILESRSISIDMKPSSKLFSNPVLPENALELKNRLTAFRATHYAKELSVADKPAHGRLGDIISPLYHIMLTFFPDKKDIFTQMLKKIEMQKKEDATDSVEGKLLETVITMTDQVQDAFLPIDLIANRFNEGKDNKFAIQHETIGRILKGLGFAKRRGAGGKRGVYYDSELIKRLALQYGIDTSYDSSDNETDIQKSVIEESQNKNDGVGNTPSQPSLMSKHEELIAQDTGRDMG